MITYFRSQYRMKLGVFVAIFTGEPRSTRGESFFIIIG